MYNIEKIDSLLKNEISATETYRQALESFWKDTRRCEVDSLLQICQDHNEAAALLKAQIRQLGGAPSDKSSNWGTWEKIFQIGVNMLGKYSAIEALRDVEFSCSKAYGQALLDYQLPLALRSLIETKLLPNLQSNMRTLDQLLDAVMA
ncbi:DUF2383 domain-containing protein [Methylomonas sp. MO1]|uniref:DUF2383 domain-containing protein n=1 Tax=Methylomonas sp. MO1 TaxID=3073619 RepID=UPI0028A429CA|nr:DUF2383 domain-containing protein [Methylomonas sp. MO1]MDT4288399.1 DUF2383 domain-containing protein [Methylomonas sp. MO1]